MIILNKNVIAIDGKDCPKDVSFTNFDINYNYTTLSSILKIEFKTDINYNISCIKKLIQLENNNLSYLDNYDNYKLKYIISNYNDDIITALKAICISDIKERYTFIYDSIFNYLDKIWKEKNPCNFCDNKCIATREGKFINQENGCCYSFEYSDSLFTPSFIKNKKQCQYLKDDKSCATENMSCKLHVCHYLKKYKNFNIDIDNNLLFKSFFSKKQQLILKYNHFHIKEELINKLLEPNNTPYIIYYLKSKYRI